MAKRQNTPRIEFLHTVRDWCLGLGICFLALALMSISNTVTNPDTWSSAYNALAASGLFAHYAGWLFPVGTAFLLIAFLVAVCLKYIDR